MQAMRCGRHNYVINSVVTLTLAANYIYIKTFKTSSFKSIATIMPSLISQLTEVNADYYFLLYLVGDIIENLSFMRLELADGTIPRFPTLLIFAPIPNTEDEEDEDDE